MNKQSVIETSSQEDQMLFQSGMFTELIEMIELSLFFIDAEQEYTRTIELIHSGKYTNITISNRLKSHIEKHLVLDPEMRAKAIEKTKPLIVDLLAAVNFKQAKKITEELSKKIPDLSRLYEPLNGRDYLIYIGLLKARTPEGKQFRDFLALFEPIHAHLEANAEQKRLEKETSITAQKLKWFTASEQDDARTIKSMLADGYNIETKNKEELHILLHASQFDSTKVIDIILDHIKEYEADYNSADLFYFVPKIATRTSLEYILKGGLQRNLNLDLIRLVDGYGSNAYCKNFDLLLQYAEPNQKLMAKIVLYATRNRNYPNYNFRTFLEYGLNPTDDMMEEACDYQNKAALLLFIEFGGNKNVLRYFDNSLLAHAIDRSLVPTIEALLERNAELLTRDNKTKTNLLIKLEEELLGQLTPQAQEHALILIRKERALFEAKKKWFNIIETENLTFLYEQIQAGFDIDTPNEDGKTLLALALDNRSKILPNIMYYAPQFPPEGYKPVRMLWLPISHDDDSNFNTVYYYLKEKNIAIDWSKLIMECTLWRRQDAIPKLLMYAQLSQNELYNLAMKAIADNQSIVFEMYMKHHLNPKFEVNGVSLETQVLNSEKNKFIEIMKKY